MSLSRWSAAARFGGPGVLLGLALAAMVGGQRGLHAQGATPAAIERPRPVPTPVTTDTGGILAMTAPLHQGSISGSGQLLYLIDTKSRAFAIYRIDPAHDKGTIKLEGVRQFHWDLKLAEYQNQKPEVDAIEAAVKAAGVRAR